VNNGTISEDFPEDGNIYGEDLVTDPHGDVAGVALAVTDGPIVRTQ
jgi:hypothetical protein